MVITIVSNKCVFTDWTDGIIIQLLKKVKLQFPDIWSQLPDEERTNIYNGIGYNQGAGKTAGIPPQFVKEKLSFELHQLELNLMKDSGTVLTSEFDHFHFGFQRRPVNNSLM